MTLPEVVVVLAITGIIVGMSITRLTSSREQSGRIAARQQLLSAFAAARAAAVQKGKTATLTLTDTSATVSALNARGDSSLVVWGPSAFNDPVASTVAALNGAPATLTYDARGLLSPTADGTLKYEIRLGSIKDTVCLTAQGMLMPRGCTL